MTALERGDIHPTVTVEDPTMWGLQYSSRQIVVYNLTVEMSEHPDVDYHAKDSKD